MSEEYSRLDCAIYTLRHKIAFLKTEKELLGKNTLAGYLHDSEKILMYLFCFWLTTEEAHEWHKNHSKHHAENNIPKTEADYTQMLIDWECARYTKPDKPLNAYDTLIKLHPNVKKQVLPLIKKYLPHQIRERA